MSKTNREIIEEILFPNGNVCMSQSPYMQKASEFKPAFLENAAAKPEIPCGSMHNRKMFPHSSTSNAPRHVRIQLPRVVHGNAKRIPIVQIAMRENYDLPQLYIAHDLIAG